MHRLLPLAAALLRAVPALSQCFADPATNAEWAAILTEDGTATEFSVEGSCCQEQVCGLGCAEEVPPPPAVSRDICSTCSFARIEHHFVCGREI